MQRLYAPPLPIYRNGRRLRAPRLRSLWLLFNPFCAGFLAIVLWLMFLTSSSNMYISIFDELGGELPAPTRFLIGLNHTLATNAFTIFTLSWLAAAIIGLPFYFRPKLWKKMWLFPVAILFAEMFITLASVLAYYLPLFNIPKLIR